MPITKQQFEESGLKLINWEGGTQIIGGSGQRTPYARNVDSQALQYLQSIGVEPTKLSRVQRPGSDPRMNESIFVDPDGNNANFDWNTSGGTTFTMSGLENAYAQVGAKKAEQAEASRVQSGNAAIQAGNKADVEKYFPGYTLHNGTFMQTSQVANFQAEAAKANDPNWIPVKVGNGTAYIPKGSAGEANLPNIGTQNTANATNATAQTPAQAVNYTVPQSTNANNGVYKTWNGTNWDVFDTKGNSIDQATFQQKGLNIDHINTRDVLANQAKPSFSDYKADASTLTGSGTIPTGGGTGGVSDYSGDINGAFSSLPSAEVTGDQKKVDDTYKAIQDQITALSGEEAYQQQQEDAQGVTATKAQIRDLTAQLFALQASSGATQAQLEGRPMSMAAIVGQQGEVGRQTAIKALGISSQIQALNGNLQTAVDAVNRMVDLKYAPERAKLDALQVQLQQNRDQLSSSEKKQADALNRQYDMQQTLLANQIADEKQIKTQLLKLQADYLGAGITLDDTLESAQQKIVNSPQYKAEQAKVQKNSPNGKIPTPESPDNPENGGYDLSTVAGIVDAVKIGGDNLADIRQWLDSETKLTADSINSLIKEAEKQTGTSETSSKLTRENLSKLFGIPDDNVKTIDGFFGWPKANNKRLDELMAAIEKYQAVGKSDAEILKLMQ